MCWANQGCDCTQKGTPCPYVCEKCGHRIMGALGHGPPCRCKGQRTAQEVFLSQVLFPDAPTQERK